MRKSCLGCTGREEIWHRHKIWVPPDVPPLPGQNPPPLSCPARINIWIVPAFLQTLTIDIFLRFSMGKSKKCSAPEMAELRVFALSAHLTAKGKEHNVC